MRKKSFVLLSGGLDSTTCLHQAIFDGIPENPDISFSYGDEEVIAMTLRNADPSRGGIDIPWVECVSVNYGQRHKKELDYAIQTCYRLGIPHTILDFGDLLKGESILLSAESIGSMDMVHTSYDKIQGVSPSYVPFRNGLMLSALTAHVQKWVNSSIDDEVKSLRDKYNELQMSSLADDEAGLRDEATKKAKDLATIYYGAHAEDAQNWAYPDCTLEFNGSMANAIYTGSYNTIRLATPLQWLKKHEIVSKGEKLGVDFQGTWSCYDAKEHHCGVCPTCIARREAFMKAKVADPTLYLESADIPRQPPEVFDDSVNSDDIPF